MRMKPTTMPWIRQINVVEAVVKGTVLIKGR
jgi:hypothetical protein